MSWSSVKLSDVCEINIGKTPARANPVYWGKGHPWLSIADMNQGRELCTTKEEITDLGVKESNIKFVPKGTVLFSFKLSIGKIGITQRNMYTNEAIAALPIKDRKMLCEEYLVYALTIMDAGKTTDRAVMGATLNKKKLAELKIPLPPLEEQKRIAAILDKADAVRRKRQQAIDLTDQLLRSVFLDMFGDPVTNPKGWEICLFGDVVDNRDSKRIPVKEADRDLRHGKYPYYGSVGIIDYIDDFIFEGEHLLISEDGKHLENRNRPIACIARGQFWVNNHAHVVEFNGKADLLYLAHLLEMISIKKYITGIDQFKLNRKSLDRIPIPIPPVELQKKFRETLEQTELNKKNMKLFGNETENLFGTLTQGAFRGELTKQTEAA